MYSMDKKEYLEELDKKISTLTGLMQLNDHKKNTNEARRLSGKIEGVKLARDFAEQWLREDI